MNVKGIDALGRLHAFVNRYKTRRDAASALGITPQYLSDLLSTRRDLSDKMLAKLGLRRVVVK